MLWNIISYFKKNWNIFKRILNSTYTKFAKSTKIFVFWKIKTRITILSQYFAKMKKYFHVVGTLLLLLLFFFFYAIDNADNRTSRRTSAVRDSNLLHQFRSIPPTHQIPSSSKLKFPALNFFHVPPVAHYSFLTARNWSKDDSFFQKLKNMRS